MVCLLEYAELLKGIDEMEANSTRPEVNTIDLTLLFGSKTEQHAKIQFKQLLSAAMDMEAVHLQALQAQQKAAQTQSAKSMQTQVQPIATGTTLTSASVVTTQPPRQQPQQPQPTQAHQINKPNEFSAAKAELDSFAKGLGSDLNTAPVKLPDIKQKENENVLFKLSLADQVAELERIIEGLNEHAFNNEQLEIIRKEALGLKKVLQKGLPEKEAGDPERFLIFGILRDKRLEEVLTLLSVSDV